MLSRRGGLSAWRTAGRLSGLACIVLSAGLLACGVPISDAELTATADGDRSATADRTSSSASSSLLAAQATAPALQTPTLTPAATANATPAAAAPAASAPAAPTASAAATSAPPARNADLAAEVVKLFNDYRAGRGLSSLRVNSALTAAAADYARLIAEGNYWGSNPHIGPDGSTPQSRLKAAGYAGRYKGETMAAGQPSAQDVLDTWLNSPAHTAIVLDAAAVEIGVGYYYSGTSYYGYYWVLDTGVP